MKVNLFNLLKSKDNTNEDTMNMLEKLNYQKIIKDTNNKTRIVQNNHNKDKPTVYENERLIKN